MEKTGGETGHDGLTDAEAFTAFALAVAAGGGFLPPEARTSDRLVRDTGLSGEETEDLGPGVLEAAARTWQELGKQGIA